MEPTERLFDETMLGSLKDSLDAAQLQEMMQGMYDMADDLLANINKALDEKNADDVAAHAHGLRGMTANFGFTALADLAGELEQAGKNGAGIDRLKTLAAPLRDCYKNTRAQIENWMK